MVEDRKVEVIRRTDHFWNCETGKGTEIMFHAAPEDRGRGRFAHLLGTIMFPSRVEIRFRPAVEVDDVQCQVLQAELAREAERRELPRPHIYRSCLSSLGVEWTGLRFAEFSEAATVLSERLDL